MHVASSVNNVSQFDNFTIEWQSFSLFKCAVPAAMRVSLFSCVSPMYTQLDYVSCLQVTTVDFNGNTCQSTTAISAVNIIISQEMRACKIIAKLKQNKLQLYRLT